MSFIIMLVLQIACVALTLCYVMLMLLYKHGWKLQQDFIVPHGFMPITRISIIIPARNEEVSIAACIESMLTQNYPQHLLEIIVVDDHSTDNTAAIVNAFGHPNIRCISLADFLLQQNIVAYKKAALTAGIINSSGELIVTTDADCTAPKNWLLNIAALYQQQQPAMIVGPVDFTSDGSFVQTFQSLDFMSMQGITAAVHRLKLGSMSNGANLAFTRQAYEAVNGYQGIDHLASGDDYLLMHKMQQAFPCKLAYLKSQAAIVKTAPQPDWGSFFQQRIRWASKSGKYDDKKMTLMLLLVYLFNMSFLALVIAGIFEPSCFLLAVGMLAAKIVTELFLLYPVARFFGKEKQLYAFPLLQPLHIVYIVLAGLLGFVGVYKWKGRTVK